eukprot:TRINITY_DN54699_c0_g1_i1.p1 TRINITY_DN54699_c0_g1~~TRINITY_DN54699_c0_g1_i1.p1  ORF type:complete len:257 (-),score=71.80 TRINITY_DN54699_c0_g1_i1:124-894(-)
MDQAGGSSGSSASPAEACVAKWQEAQRSPSIVGFKTASSLSETLVVTSEDDRAPVADIRLWEGPACEGATRVYLELLFPSVPDSLFERLGEMSFGERVVASVEAYLKEHRVDEFRGQLAKRQEAATLRRRGGASDDADGEGGDSKEESWREFLRKPHEQAEVRLHRVVDLGARGRKVLAVQLIVGPSDAEALGRLAYPQFFIEKTPEEDAALDRAFNCCYYGCIVFVVLLVTLWLSALVRGIMKSHPHPKRALDEM